MPAQPFPDPLALVLFSAGGWRLGLEARHVGGARVVPAGQAGPWLGSLLGLQAGAAGAPCQGLRIRGPEGDREFLTEGPVELLHVAWASVHPLPALVAARCTLAGLCGVALPEDGLGPILLLDPCRWPGWATWTA